MSMENLVGYLIPKETKLNFGNLLTVHFYNFLYIYYTFNNQLIKIMEEQQNSGYDSTKKRIDEATDNFEQQAKHTANEFKEGWNQVSHTQENKKILAGILAIVIGSL